jgi:nitronate monooxygenase
MTGTWRTAFTELMAVDLPIASAPMGGSAGGRLAAAVSEGGGLGLVGGDVGNREWLNRELTLVAAATRRPWGVGFLTWAVSIAAVEQALGFEPAAIMLSFGDPRPFLPTIRAAGVPVILQVTDIEEARQAVDLGADVIVAQGTEAGGHGAARGRSTLPFVPVVVDLAGDIPVLAAGGIADGRGVAAALALGAAGALVGTRFQATPEALVDPRILAAVLEGQSEDTERSTVLDVVRGSTWPSRYTGRTLSHPVLDAWRGREAELAADESAKQAYARGVADGELPPLPVWAGEGLDLITSPVPARDLVVALADECARTIVAMGDSVYVADQGVGDA